MTTVTTYAWHLDHGYQCRENVPTSQRRLPFTAIMRFIRDGLMQDNLVVVPTPDHPDQLVLCCRSLSQAQRGWYELTLGPDLGPNARQRLAELIAQLPRGNHYDARERSFQPPTFLSPAA